ncbi:MAG: ABC transporter substrate-binding protein [Fimbriimonadaceae bacterium]|nr:ABC transporter substrate-binding protein [Fimbriimonadaceae bacterium]
MVCRSRLRPFGFAAVVLAAWLSGCAPASKGLPKVGFAQYTSTTSLDALRSGFVEGLAEGGFVDGQSVEIQYVNAQADNGTLQLGVQKLAADVELVGLCSTQALQAAVKAVRDKPIVYCGVIDPVAAGAATSPTSANANVTGVYNPFPVKEGIEMVRKLMPNVRKIGTLYDPGEPFFGQMHQQAKDACAAFGGEFVVVSVTSSNDITTGVQSLKSQGVEAILQLPSNTVNQGIDGQVKTARELKLPIFSLQPDQLEKGVVAAVGIDLRDAGKQAGKMAARVLKGEKPAAIPMETAKITPLEIREASAREFGIALPRP